MAHLSLWPGLPNAWAKRIRKLHTKKGRQASGLFLAQGTKAVKALLASQYAVHALVGTASFWNNDGNANLSTNCTCFVVKPDKLTALSTLRYNRDVLAVAESLAVSASHCPALAPGSWV